MAKIDDGSEDGVSGTNLLDALDGARVFRVKKMDDGRFFFQETCDYYFGATLTKTQVLALAEELRALTLGA